MNPSDESRSGPVRVIECNDCGGIQSPWQDRYCVRCWSRSLSSRPARGNGRLVTWATFVRSFGLENFEAPYTVGWVELEEGPRVPCLLEGDAHVDYQRSVSVSAVEDVSALSHAQSAPDEELHAYLHLGSRETGMR